MCGRITLRTVGVCPKCNDLGYDETIVNWCWTEDERWEPYDLIRCPFSEEARIVDGHPPRYGPHAVCMQDDSFGEDDEHNEMDYRVNICGERGEDPMHGPLSDYTCSECRKTGRFQPPACHPGAWPGHNTLRYAYLGDDRVAEVLRPLREETERADRDYFDQYLDAWRNHPEQLRDDQRVPDDLAEEWLEESNLDSARREREHREWRNDNDLALATGSMPPPEPVDSYDGSNYDPNLSDEGIAEGRLDALQVIEDPDLRETWYQERGLRYNPDQVVIPPDAPERWYARYRERLA